MRQLQKLSSLRFLILAVTAMVAMADTVDNPGAVTATALAGSSITIGPQQLFLSNAIPASTVSGTADAAGALTLPADQTSFQPAQIMVGAITVNVQLVATQDGFGSINPSTGQLSATLSLRIDMSGFLIPAGCQIPETTIVLTTDDAGGVPYDPATGTATVVDTTFAVPASVGCGVVGGLINGGLGLPSASGLNVFKLNVSLDPILTGS